MDEAIITTAPEPPVSTVLPEALSRIRDVDGWLTLAQAARLHRAATRLERGSQIVEIGSFRGRSTIVLALAAPPGCTVIAIDPHAGNDRGPQEIEGFATEAGADHERFHDNLSRAGVDGRVRHIRAFSDAAHDDVYDPVHLLYIDGAHRFAPARQDIVGWGGRVVDGGTMLIHDAFSSVGVTLASLVALFASSTWEYVGRDGSLVEYRKGRCRGVARVRSAVRQVAVLPWFVRNVVIKALIVARLGPLTRLLGHRQPTWPY